MIGEALFTYTPQDMVAMQYAWWMGAAQWRSFVVTFVVILIVYLVMFCGIDLVLGTKDLSEGVKWAVGLAAVMTVAVFGIGFLLAPILGRRALRENRMIGGEYHWRWDEDALHIRFDRGHVDVPWELLAGWLDAPKVLLLYQSKRLVFALPKRALTPAETGQLIALLRVKPVRERRRFGVIAAPTG